jgi:hypothetical protein
MRGLAVRHEAIDDESRAEAIRPRSPNYDECLMALTGYTVSNLALMPV